MGLLKPDLYRNFTIGFAIGAAAVVWNAVPDWQTEFAGEAHAAERIDAERADAERVAESR